MSNSYLHPAVDISCTLPAQSIPLFVNYYQKGRSPVRGGNVYAARLSEYLPTHGVNVLNISWKSRKYAPMQLGQYLTFPYWQMFRTGRADLVHLPTPFDPGCLVGGRKTVTTFHDQVNYEFYQSRKRGNSLLRALERLSAANTDYVIAPSQFTADRTVARFPKFENKIEVVNPGISEEFFETRSEAECEATLARLSLYPSDPYLLYVGALSDHKNHRRTLEAYIKVRQSYPDLKLVMVGNIRKRREFPEFVRWLSEQELTLGKDVFVPSFHVSTKDLSVLYQKASVFLFPSLYEGWGIVVGEAFASKTPTVISDIPVFRECFDGGALMVDPLNVNEIAEGVITMLTDTQLRNRYVERGNQLIQGQTWRKVARDTLDVYERLLGQHTAHY